MVRRPLGTLPPRRKLLTASEIVKAWQQLNRAAGWREMGVAILSLGRAKVSTIPCPAHDLHLINRSALKVTLEHWTLWLDKNPDALAAPDDAEAQELRERIEAAGKTLPGSAIRRLTESGYALVPEMVEAVVLRLLKTEQPFREAWQRGEFKESPAERLCLSSVFANIDFKEQSILQGIAETAVALVYRLAHHLPSHRAVTGRPIESAEFQIVAADIKKRLVHRAARGRNETMADHVYEMFGQQPFHYEYDANGMLCAIHDRPWQAAEMRDIKAISNVGEAFEEALHNPVITGCPALFIKQPGTIKNPVIYTVDCLLEAARLGALEPEYCLGQPSSGQPTAASLKP